MWYGLLAFIILHGCVNTLATIRFCTSPHLQPELLTVTITGRYLSIDHIWQLAHAKSLGFQSNILAYYTKHYLIFLSHFTFLINNQQRRGQGECAAFWKKLLQQLKNPD